jgi:hypothetical protein
MTDVGDGDIAFEPFFAGLDTSDHHYIVERDTAPTQWRTRRARSAPPSAATTTWRAFARGTDRTPAPRPPARSLAPGGRDVVRPQKVTQSR